MAGMKGVGNEVSLHLVSAAMETASLHSRLDTAKTVSLLHLPKELQQVQTC